MPCRDWDHLSDVSERISKTEAMLCGTFRALIRAHGGEHLAMQAIDFKEAGVSIQYFRTWWENHKMVDNIRKRREAEENDRRKARARALLKLTKEDRKALGLK